MKSHDTLIAAGMTISKSMALDYILSKVKNATKIFQRKLRSLENKTLEELEKMIDDAKEDHDTRDQELEQLEEQHWNILKEVCDR